MLSYTQRFALYCLLCKAKENYQSCINVTDEQTIRESFVNNYVYFDDLCDALEYKNEFSYLWVKIAYRILRKYSPFNFLYKSEVTAL